MKKRYYIVDRENNEIIHGYIDYHQIKGFDIKPHNTVEYDGIQVGHMTLVEPELIERVLKRKTKRKLSTYLNFLLSLVDDDDTDPDGLQLVIDDVERYKNIIINKYSKFLDKRYIKSLLKKVGVVENELKTKLKELSLNEEKEIGRRR